MEMEDSVTRTIVSVVVIGGGGISLRKRQWRRS